MLVVMLRWVGGISLHGVPLSVPSLVTPEFRELFRLGRATIPTGVGGGVHLFVVYGYQGVGGGFGKAPSSLLTSCLVLCGWCGSAHDYCRGLQRRSWYHSLFVKMYFCSVC